MSAVHLRPVKSSKITFLVDNCIEWMTKLPPEFSGEVAVHLRHQSPPVDPITGVPFVDLENYCCGAHGFSALIPPCGTYRLKETQAEEEDPHVVLFDTGPDSRSIIRNVESLQVETGKIERVIISHWHADHSGGLLALLKYRKGRGLAAEKTKSIVVDVHPNRPIARGIAVPPTFEKVIGRLPQDPSFDAIKQEGALVETHDEPHVIAGDTVFISGEIPRVTNYETGMVGAVRWQEAGGWKIEEHIMDERYAALDVLGKGLVIFSACSHAGIVNVCRDAIERLQRPIYMVIGGLHLAGPEFQSRIGPTVKFLAEDLRPAPVYVLPMHCSGFACKIALQQALGEGCVPAGVGMVVKVVGDEEGEKMLRPPTLKE